MLVVRNARATPLSPEDGEVIARLPGGRDGTAHTIRTPMNLSLAGVRAFVDHGGQAESQAPVRVRHPEVGKPRV
jgi:hypothetical protein